MCLRSAHRVAFTSLISRFSSGSCNTTSVDDCNTTSVGEEVSELSTTAPCKSFSSPRRSMRSASKHSRPTCDENRSRWCTTGGARRDGAPPVDRGVSVDLVLSPQALRDHLPQSAPLTTSHWSKPIEAHPTTPSFGSTANPRRPLTRESLPLSFHSSATNPVVPAPCRCAACAENVRHRPAETNRKWKSPKCHFPGSPKSISSKWSLDDPSQGISWILRSQTSLDV